MTRESAPLRHWGTQTCPNVEASGAGPCVSCFAHIQGEGVWVEHPHWK